MGNKVETPKSFLLDQQGNLIHEGEGTYIQNPIDLTAIRFQELQQILQIAQDKGYKMNLTSPKTYKGAKGLNHNHVLNIGEGNYMSFDHIYTITGFKDNMLTIFNPHGTAAKAKTFFDADLHQLMQELSTIKQKFEKDYKSKSFSPSSKDAMRNIVQQLKASAFNSNFGKITTLLDSIQEEGLIKKKGDWVFAKKAYEKKFDNFIAVVDKLLASSLGRGFVKPNDKIEIIQDQKISLKTIKKFFSFISINIIKV